MEGRLTFNILGPVEVLDGARPVDIGGPKQRAVLAALVIEVGTVVSLDRLIDRLWGDQPPARATGTLHAYISNLRRVLEPNRSPRSPAGVLATHPPGYVLNVPPDTVDAVRFERLVIEGRDLVDAGRAADAMAVLDEALDLWRGPPLDDLAFETSFRAEITRLHELHGVAVESRLSADLAVGRHHNVVAQIEPLVERHPLRERLWELYVVALYRAGRQGDALRVLRTARETLRDELGVDPGPGLQRLEQEVLHHDPALDWAPPRPAPLSRLGASTRPVGATTRSGEPLVARDEALAALSDALDRARAGGGLRLVLLAGEPGVGKTRCVEEFARRASADGIAVAWARCPDSEGAPALWPWVQLLRPILADVPPNVAEEALATRRMDLAPVLRFLDPGSAHLATPDDDGDTRRVGPMLDAVADVDAARFRLHDSVVGVFARLLDDRPQVMILDDLQWADSSSLRLLQFLVADRRLSHVLVVGTYRDVDVLPDSAIQELLTAVAGEPSVEQHSLERFGRDAVRAYITASTGLAVDEDVVDAVHDRTSGNAFFVAELVRLLASEDRLRDAAAVRTAGRIPSEVHAVIRRRLARLPREVTEILTLAAAIGEEFGTDALERAAELPLDRVLDLVDLALVTRIIVEAPSPGRFRFVHSLVRDTLYEASTSIQRARLHASVGRALYELWETDLQPHLSELAYHFSLGAPAGTAQLALEFATRAANLATAQLTHAEAALHWQQALDALEIARPADVETRYELLMRCSAAHRCAGDIERSRRVVHEALAIVTRMDDDERLARAAVSFSGGAGWAWSWRSYNIVDTEAIDLLERALLLLGPDDTMLRCDVLAALAIELYYVERDRAIELGRQALAMAERLGDQQLVATMLNVNYVSSLGPNRPEGQLAIAERMIGLDGVAGEVSVVGHMYRASARLELGDIAAVDADLDEAERTARTLRQPAMLAQVAWCRAMRPLLEGRFEDAEEKSVEAFELHKRTSLWGALECYCTQLFTLRRDQGRILELQPLLADLAATSEFVGFREAAALMYLDLGRPRDALDVLGERATFPSMPLDWSWEFLSCLQAEVCAGLGDRAAAERLLSELEPFGDLLAVIGTGICCWGPVSYFLGRLAATLGRRTEAEQRLAHAVETATRIGAAPWRARAARHLEAITRATAPLVADP